MTYSIQISGQETNHKGSALVFVQNENTRLIDGGVDIDLSRLIFNQQMPSETALDLLLIASTVYTLDRTVERFATDDRWTRNISVRIPVYSSELWFRATDKLTECLNFLSGDKWEFIFENRTVPLYYPKQHKKRKNVSFMRQIPDTVSLFSGGVDSLVGVIDWLENNSDKTIALVGHHDTTIAGVKSLQEKVFETLNKVYTDRTVSHFSGIGPNRSKGHGSIKRESTTRSRSFMFLAMGVFLADMIGKNVPVLIPENGTIALNVPLTPSRRGSCSTRTAHPYYLNLFQCLLQTINLFHPIVNPLMDKTKGEVVSNCLNQQILRITLEGTVSCAKSGHVRCWTNRTANSCGACMPCIYRRAAFHKAGIDSETYGYDICKGDVDPDDKKSDTANDLRACLFFLSNKYSVDAIARMLWSNGNIAADELQNHAETISRAMEEVRQFFRDKGTKRIKQIANR